MSEGKENVVVLVADDEPSTLALVAAHVRSHGYTVHEASDGDQAWQLAHEHLPDLVVLDVMMPGMSGWEVCRKIREAVSLAHTGVIMLTGIGENLNEMTSPLYGADSYLDKPFEFSVLDERIAEVLAKRKKSHAMGRPEETTAPERHNGGARGTVARASSRPPALSAAKAAKTETAGAKPAKATKPAQVAKPAPKASRTAKKKATKKAAKKAPPKAKTRPSSKKKSAKKKAARRKVARAAPAKKKVSKKVTRKASRRNVARRKPGKALARVASRPGTSKASPKKPAAPAPS